MIYVGVPNSNLIQAFSLAAKFGPLSSFPEKGGAPCIALRKRLNRENLFSEFQGVPKTTFNSLKAFL